MNCREFVAGGLALSAAAKAGAAWAQSGPLTRIVFPFAAAAAATCCAAYWRISSRALDRNFIVENRTGGDGLIGIRSVKGTALMAPPS